MAKSKETAREQDDGAQQVQQQEDQPRQQNQDEARKTQPTFEGNKDSVGEGNFTNAQLESLRVDRGNTRSDPDARKAQPAAYEAWNRNNPESFPSNEADDQFGGPSLVAEDADADEHERVAKLDAANRIPDSSANTAVSTAVAENPEDRAKK